MEHNSARLKNYRDPARPMPTPWRRRCDWPRAVWHYSDLHRQGAGVSAIARTDGGWEALVKDADAALYAAKAAGRDTVKLAHLLRLVRSGLRPGHTAQGFMPLDAGTQEPDDPANALAVGSMLKAVGTMVKPHARAMLPVSLYLLTCYAGPAPGTGSLRAAWSPVCCGRVSNACCPESPT
jgi:hypothetical protein